MRAGAGSNEVGCEVSGTSCFDRALEDQKRAAVTKRRTVRITDPPHARRSPDRRYVDAGLELLAVAGAVT